jgi:predicted TIM-barrel fold metal-dependent hydrolase
MDVGSGVVDAHVHVFPAEMVQQREVYLERDEWFAALYRSPAARMATANEVVAEMAASGVETSVIFGFAFRDQGLCRMINDYVLEAVSRYPERLAGLACVSPDSPGALAELERCLDAGLRGCGELLPDGQGFGRAWNALAGTGSGSPQARPGPGPGAGLLADGLPAVAQCLAERCLPLLVHANEPVGHHYPGKGSFTPEACLALARAFPGLTIVFAHMGGGLFLYELMPEVRAALTRVYYDTLAVPYLYGPEVYAAAVSCVGEGKLIFGSDYPLLPPGRYVEGLERLSPPARAAALGGTARKVFGL